VPPIDADWAAAYALPVATPVWPPSQVMRLAAMVPGPGPAAVNPRAAKMVVSYSQYHTDRGEYESEHVLCSDMSDLEMDRWDRLRVSQEEGASVLCRSVYVFTLTYIIGAI
jgi:hypothetical protein